MSSSVVGILGGMGPEATLDCFAKIIANTPASRDQDHLRVIINNDPSVPDRTAAILGRGESPVPALIRGCLTLERAGADFVIIPCISAHVFLGEIRARVQVPILSMFDAVAEAIVAGHPDLRAVGLIGTSGTIAAGAFAAELRRRGLEVVVPEAMVQETVMECIYAIKNTCCGESRENVVQRLQAAVDHLIRREPAAAQGIVAACTEIPLALTQAHLSVPYFDSLAILAQRAVAVALGHSGPRPAVKKRCDLDPSIVG